MRARLKGLEPRSVLDVGCGAGELLLELRRGGCPHCVGLESDPHALAAARASGVEAVAGRGEALPFPASSFDVVVLEYVAHHLADLGAGLREAARVARRAVVVLESWYEPGLPSQDVAMDYDRWRKAIDRRLGLVHNPCPTAADLAGPLLEREFTLDFAHRLLLRPLGLDSFAQEARSHLDRIGTDREECERELTVLLERAGLVGVSDDGGLLLVATAPCRARQAG